MILSGLSVLLAMGGPPAPPGTQADPRGQLLGTIGMFVIMGVMFYFVLIRPQQKKAKEQADLLGRVLDARPAAEPGERDATLLRIAGLLAYWLPATTPFDTVLELCLPALRAMDTQPEGLESWIDEFRDMFERQAASRKAADEQAALAAAAMKRNLDALAGRPIREAALDPNWEKLLVLGKGDSVKACEHNVDLLLSCAEGFRGSLVWNEAKKTPEVRGGLLAGLPANSLDGRAAGILQSRFGCMAGESMVSKAILRVARENPFDPVVEALGELAWDGVPRADTFFETYLAVDVTDPAAAKYVRAVSRRWLISLVARALRPGCKVDTVLILEGEQGAGKSTALEALVGSSFFLDTSLDITSKDGMQMIAGAWLVELGELASFQKAEGPRVRQFVTSKVDHFRLPYGRVVEGFPRRCVFVGTCNPEEGRGYLTDRTGNRRYWPVRVGKKIDVDGVLAVREQILAEAVAAFRAGERWHLVDDEVAVAAEQAAEREDESPIGDAVERWWFGMQASKRPTRVTMLDVVESALLMTADKASPRIRVEVGWRLSSMGFRRRGRDRAYYATDALRAATGRERVTP